MQPKGLQIVPVNFGTFNVSWMVDAAAEQWITHYELVMINLNEEPSLEDQARCELFLRSQLVNSELSPTSDTIVHDKQLTVNISAPASFIVINGLPPDNFYRVMLFALSDSQRSPPASMPSSPRVPSLAPLTSPTDVMVTTRGTREAKVAWKPPDGADCTGELMNYVISINSSRLLEPLIIRVAPDTRSYVVRDLIPGTYYTVQLAATTRGGAGVASEPLRFRTGGELPRVDLDEDSDDELESPFAPEDSHVELGLRENSFDGTPTWDPSVVEELTSPKYYMIPAKIQNLRAQSYQTSIQLKWSVALRGVNPALEHDLLMNNEEPARSGMLQPKYQHQKQPQLQPIRIRLSEGSSASDRIGYLPPGTKYVIRWGDMHPGPSEDTVMGDQTEYLIRDLRPNTMYYIRVIAVTLLGEGPAAYTMVMTQAADSDELTKTSRGVIIPVNLVVRAVGTNWARVSWELPELPKKTAKAQSLLFQIKYRAINQQDSTLFSQTESAEVNLINVTVPWTNQLSKQSKQFKATLQGLKQATQYEFGVCMIHPITMDHSAVSARLTSSKRINDICWSMVQGFETIGQGPSDPPRDIRISFKQSMTSARATEHYRNASSGSSVHVHWTPPSQPNGDITSYAVYWTNDRKQTLSNWLELAVPGTVRECYLQPKPLPSQNYFLRMVSRNRHGASPFSAVVVFRTPDTYGQGGGRIKLSKVYYDARDIHEALDQIRPDSDHYNNTLHRNNLHTSDGEDGNGDQLRWIILGSVLGGTAVCLVVAVVVMCRRCYYSRRPSGVAKWLPAKSPYLGDYVRSRHHSVNQLPIDVVAKAANVNIADACLGSCSLTGSGNGGSTGGLQAGLRAPLDASGDSGIQYDYSVRHANKCSCHTWSAIARTQSHYHCSALDANRCVCQNISKECSIPSNWIPPNVGGCWDDRQSTPAASEHDAGGSSTNGSRMAVENGISREHTSGLRLHQPPEVSSALREMTLSFLSANVHQNSSGHYQAERADIPHHHSGCLKSTGGRLVTNGYPVDICDRSPDVNLVHSRHIMVAYTGSGSTNDDEGLAASPCSSSAGRASAGISHPSVSPTHAKFSGKIYSPQSSYPIVKLEPSSLYRNHGPAGQGLSDEKTNLPNDATKFNSVTNTKGMYPSKVILQPAPDYASQQSNPSSASSPVGTSYFTERHMSTSSTPTGSDSRAAQIGMSFALDRVPTPEPTPRPAPFSRLATGELNQLVQKRMAIENLKELNGGGQEDLSLISPSLLKKHSAQHSPSGLEREYSAEELHQEMANLEGLMKDLNKIAANEFDC